MNYHAIVKNYELVHILEFDFVKPQFVVLCLKVHSKNDYFTYFSHD